MDTQKILRLGAKGFQEGDDNKSERVRSCRPKLLTWGQKLSMANSAEVQGNTDVPKKA